jgi:hypothetical protein
VLYAIRCIYRTLVLPDPEDRPPECLEALVGVPVTTSVRLELLPPPTSVVLGPRPVLRAAVPEAAVDEDSEPCAWEHHVCTTAHPLSRCTVDPVSKASSVELFA